MRKAQLPSSYLRALFPTIPVALPANDRVRSPTVLPTTLACGMTNALLMHLSRPFCAIVRSEWTAASLLHHQSSGVQMLQLRPLRFT